MCLRKSVAGYAARMVLMLSAMATSLFAQPPVHYQHAGALPPGAIGGQQLLRGGPLPGYFQPVDILAPPGAAVSLAVDNEFADPKPTPLKTGLLIGPVYRFRVTQIPRNDGAEVFPTVELINRLYPPVGQELQFPVPIELTQEELELALSGRFVTRIVYLENPGNALPGELDPAIQDYFEVLPGDDPLAVADRLGRPMAILRIGGRVPDDRDGPDATFMYNSPSPDGLVQEIAGGGGDTTVNVSFKSVALLAVAMLSLCSCRSPGRSAVTPVNEVTQPAMGTLPPQAFTGSPSDGFTRPGLPPAHMFPEVYAAPLPMATMGGPPWKPPGIACPWPADEYILDGGDRAGPVRVRDDWKIGGLDLEDTVAHYETIDGRTLIEPSNRVCIYSPRFAAVRRVDVALEDGQRVRAGGVAQPIGPLQDDDVQLASTAVQPIQPEGQIGTKSLTTFRDNELGIDLIGKKLPLAVQDRMKPYENFERIRSGLIDEAEKPFIAPWIQAAITWTADQAVQVILEGRKASVATGDARAEAVFRVDLPQNPKLRICKVANTASAQPGEIVEFTLRFDNVGDATIGNVTIVDNLTTRLEYLPNSAQASVDAEFFTEPNEGQSLALRWEIINPMKPGDGDIIRFRCRVR